MNRVITPEPYVPPIVTHVHMYRSGIRDDGPLTGSITFKGKLGKVELSLSDESCGKILSLLADAAAESVAEVSDALRQQFEGIK
jgi:hypothetical protein